ncbi:LysR family transcriptional regulator [Photobacterium sp. 53610]|uniref:LysR family transcriptional regulator n=1 Tax=Photobacterium sp. 53610 TaxID=3102789 RepID=UPI002ED88094
MDRLSAMRAFIRVAELASFTRAADELHLPKASVSNYIRLLETQSGTRLLHRTTRKVTLTQDGKVYYERCLDLLSEFDELDNLFRQTGEQLSGRIRVDMPTGTAKNVVIPHLPDFLASHPGISLELSSTDRRVDIIREGFDCVLRAGKLEDSSLIARKLGEMPLITCASPAYLKKHGIPRQVGDLSHHQLIHYHQVIGSETDCWEYEENGITREVSMKGALTVNNAESYTAACLAGIGLIQVPAMGVRHLTEQGRLVQVLSQHSSAPLPVYLLYPHRRHMAKRVQIFMDWLSQLLTKYLD